MSDKIEEAVAAALKYAVDHDDTAVLVRDGMRDAAKIVANAPSAPAMMKLVIAPILADSAPVVTPIIRAFCIDPVFLKLVTEHLRASLGAKEDR